jgi:hypothetical protein
VKTVVLFAAPLVALLLVDGLTGFIAGLSGGVIGGLLSRRGR